MSLSELQFTNVERVARAIHKVDCFNVPDFENLPRVSQERYERCARAAMAASAAPDLYEALRDVVRHLRHLSSDEENAAYKRGHAALAKARDNQ